MLLRRYHDSKDRDLSSLSVKELAALAAERGVDLAGATKKADIIAALAAK